MLTYENSTLLYEKLCSLVENEIPIAGEKGLSKKLACEQKHGHSEKIELCKNWEEHLGGRQFVDF